MFPKSYCYFLTAHSTLRVNGSTTPGYPIIADLGEAGPPYVEEVEIPKRKRQEGIHGLDSKRPEDRNSKFTLLAHKSHANRKTLCEKVCGISTEYVSWNNHSAVLQNQDPTTLLRYTEFPAFTPQSSSQYHNNNARSGYDESP